MQVIRDIALFFGAAAKRRPVGAVAATLLLSVTLLIGCGPVQSTSSINDAEVAFERARVAKAHERAPYEYYSAKFYLHKAKEEWGYSDFEAAYDYARRARREARNARIKANEDPWEGSPVKSAAATGSEQSEESEANERPASDDREEGPRGF